MKSGPLWIFPDQLLDQMQPEYLFSRYNYFYFKKKLIIYLLAAFSHIYRRNRNNRSSVRIRVITRPHDVDYSYYCCKFLLMRGWARAWLIGWGFQLQQHM